MSRCMYCWANALVTRDLYCVIGTWDKRGVDTTQPRYICLAFTDYAGVGALLFLGVL